MFCPFLDVFPGDLLAYSPNLDVLAVDVLAVDVMSVYHFVQFNDKRNHSNFWA